MGKNVLNLTREKWAGTARPRPSKHSRKRECIPENGNKKLVKTV